MTAAPVELVALNCTRCQTPLPAAVDEVAWVCAHCGQGLFLDDTRGLVPLEIRFAGTDRTSGILWRPFWVAKGKVRFKTRETYGSNRGPDDLWDSERTFVLPAFDCTLEQAEHWGVSFLRRPAALAPGAAGSLERVTVGPQAFQALAEFVVLTVEAERRDHLKAVDIDLALELPVLWVLPLIQGAQGEPVADVGAVGG